MRFRGQKGYYAVSPKSFAVKSFALKWSKIILRLFYQKLQIFVTLTVYILVGNFFPIFSGRTSFLLSFESIVLKDKRTN
jgi:hypothetical protein